MDFKDFRQDFIQEVKSTAATIGEGSSAAFVQIATDYLIGSEVLPDFIPAFLVGTGKRNRKYRVDGYVLDDFDYTMNLLIADYAGGVDNRVVTRSHAIQKFDRLSHFVDEATGDKLYKAIEVSRPCADLIDLLRRNKSKIRKYRFILITDGNMSNRIDVLPSRQIGNIQIELQIWDINRLYNVCLSDIGRQNIEIDFKAFSKKGIPCLEAIGARTDEYKSFLCIIPGYVLADLYDNFGSQLLEGNVRSFLSTKVAVNKKIRETILKAPEMFFVYNNGVSATAMDVVVEKSEEGTFITYAKHFQIINGGQTTASLSNTRHRDKIDLSTIFVQMKITEIDTNAEKSGELIRNISRSSNSQNKVTDADFFSTHPFHIRMEQISRRVFAPAIDGSQYNTKWFYERARGQYLQAQMRMSKSEKRKFVAQHPKKQLLTKTNLAKVRNSWRGLPHIVSKGAQTNFKKFAEWIDDEWITSDIKFNEKYFQESVALMILFKHTENIVTRQAWYEKGYRANIVTYSIALFHELVREQFPNKEVDLQIIWNRQSVPQIITEALITITKVVFDAITDPNRETINVTQWCKREVCWNRIKNNKSQLNTEIKRVLVDRKKLKVAEKEARKDQKLISGIEAQTKVIELGAETWRNAMEFIVNKKLATPDIMKALNMAIRIPNKLPNTYQSQKLLEVLEDIYCEGFKINNIG